MRLTATLTMIAAIPSIGRGGTAEPRTRVDVCVRDTAGVAPEVRTQAWALAQRVFSRVGVGIDWRCAQPADSQRSIALELVNGAPRTVAPGVMAYALAYERVHITVFYDRVQQVANAR